MSAFSVGDHVQVISLVDVTTGIVTQTEDVPDSPDTGKPRIELAWEPDGIRQYWESADLKAI